MGYDFGYHHHNVLNKTFFSIVTHMSWTHIPLLAEVLNIFRGGVQKIWPQKKNGEKGRGWPEVFWSSLVSAQPRTYPTRGHSPTQWGQHVNEVEASVCTFSKISHFAHVGASPCWALQGCVPQFLWVPASARRRRRALALKKKKTGMSGFPPKREGSFPIFPLDAPKAPLHSLIISNAFSTWAQLVHQWDEQGLLQLFKT